MERQLEAFIVHMSIAWTKLLQAKYERDNIDFYIRAANGRRQRTRDGDWVTKPLQQMIAEQFQDSHPIRANLNFFIGLRNKIEHRYEREIAALVTGRTQAYILNFEEVLVSEFGSSESLSNTLRFPLFVSSITDDAVAALKAVRKRVPKIVAEYIQDFDATLEPELTDHPSYEFRVYLVPKTSPKVSADVAMTFVRMDELSSDQLAVMEKAQTIIREKQVPVSDLESLLPSQIAKEVSAALGFTFSVNDHSLAWKYYKVRPPENDEHPERTKSQFCTYNRAFKRYVYTDAWVRYLVRHLSDPHEYLVVLGREMPNRASQ
ncbi:DUF3644 domain-containing protein [Actinoplanes bogorensis]|uniref:DUF3644 domain-containing protein n=2 Tax=Paractinoplanes bogorensis TaxID=1610840 RepID=A0ABS5YWH6_9ACTN|nr:DUF3644 domain-containing protein [Actinoplanes bogorensis]MBU2667792.1 DUF3644 domain-containing protein [Actinoplanes bogorensis]